MIYTFYSYKGGVGRSMALVNIAELMCRTGLNVLMVDWDLEAPGLERFFSPSQVRQALTSQGVIDMLLAYKDKMLEFKPDKDNSFFPVYEVEDYLVELPSSTTSRGRLWLLPAGQRTGDHQFAEYTNRVKVFDWQDFYQNWAGETYFEWLRKEFERVADVVLIDSRTGITEMGGVCTYQLADVVVMFCAANEQNMDGILQMVQSFVDPELPELRYGRPLKTLVVPSRIEKTAELTSLNTFRERFADYFNSYIPNELRDRLDFFVKLEIPYIPHYAFEEIIAVNQTESKQRSLDLEVAYTNLFEVFTDLAPQNSPIRSKLSKTAVPLHKAAPHTSRHLFIEAAIFYLSDTDEYITRFKTSVGNEVVPFTFFSSFNIQELHDLQQGIARSLSLDLRANTDIDRPRLFGEKLFQALFADSAFELYRACRQQLDESVSQDQRLILKISPTTETLARLPWELLYDPKYGYLSFNRRTPVIRFVSDFPPRRLIADPQWRVLLVASESAGVGPLQLRDEMLRVQVGLERELPSHVNLKIESLLAPSSKQFREVLRKFDPHVLHFMGHGGAGQLWLEEPGKSAVALRQEQLTLILQNIPSLRLVFLNACETAAAESEKNLDLAYALSQAGIPAVVANQFPARDDAAREVSDTFYRWLSSGMPVDESVLWSRLALKFFRDTVSPTLEWATPVLYLQAPDGCLFDDFLSLPSPNHATSGPKFYPGAAPLSENVYYESRPQSLYKQLKIHYDNLNRLQEQAAKWDNLHVPLYLQGEIDDEQDTITLIKAELDELEVQTEGLPEVSSIPSGKTAAGLEQQAHKVDEIQQRFQAYLEALYQQGQTAYQANQWTEALEYFQTIQGQVQDYKDVPRLLAIAKQQLQWDGLYEEGVTYIIQEQWANAIEVLSQIEPDQDHRRNLPFDLRYAQALRVYDRAQKRAEIWADRREEWSEVIQLLNPIHNYRNAADILEKTHRQANWLKNYEEGRKKWQDQAWVEAVRYFKSLPPDYRDVTKQLAQAYQQQELSERYERGRQYLKWDNWREARTEFQAILDIDPYYKDIVNLSQEVDWLEQYSQTQFERSQGRLEGAIESLALIVPTAPEHRRPIAQTMLKEWQAEARARQAYTEGVGAMQANQWQTAVNMLQSVPTDYLDAAIRLETARRELQLESRFKEAQRLVQDCRWLEALDTLESIQTYSRAPVLVNQAIEGVYQTAVAYQTKKNWGEAVLLLESLRQRRPGDPEIAARLAEIRRQKQWDDWYKEAEQAFDDKNWARAIELFQKIDEQGGNVIYQDVSQRRKQVELADLYNQTVAAMNRSEWETAEKILAAILNREANYRDASTKLAEVNRKRRANTLSNQAQAAAAAGKWTEAISDYRLVLELDPDNPQIVQQLEQAERAQRLYDLYADANRATANEEWGRAIAVYRDILAQAADYRDTQAKLEQARQAYQKDNLYQTGSRYEQEGNLAAALEQYQTLLELDPLYKDVGVRKQNLVRLLELAAHYAQAQAFLVENRAAEAIPHLQSILTVDSTYRDATHLLHQAERQSALASLYWQAMQHYGENNREAAIDSLNRLVDIDPDFRAGEVQSFLVTWQKEHEIRQAYYRGVNLIEIKRWSAAIEALEQVLSLEPGGFLDAAAQLETARREWQLKQLYDEAMGLRDQKEWSRAVIVLKNIQKLQTNYQDVPTLIDQVEEELWLKNQYAQTDQYQATGEWDKAIAILENIQRRKPGDEQISQRLVEVKHQKLLAGWHAEISQAFEAKEWAKVVRAYQKITELGASDDSLAGLARQAEHQQRLADLYNEAIAVESTDLNAAERLWAEASQIDPHYRDVQVRRAAVRRQKRLIELYSHAQEAFATENWIQALELYRQVVDIDPTYQDAAQQLKKAGQKNKVANLYASAEKAMADEDWPQAISHFQAILDVDPGLSDIAAKVKALKEVLELADLYQRAIEAIETLRFVDGIPLLQELVARSPDYRDTREQLEKAINEHYAALLKKFQYAESLEKQKRFKEAQDHYETYGEERKNSPWLQKIDDTNI